MMNATAGLIIPAAGRGERMGSMVPKAFVSLAGVPIVIHTLRRCASVGLFARAVVAVPERYVGESRELVEAEGPWPFELDVVIGGAERQDSVRRSLTAFGDDCEILVVHDAVRPFASGELFVACVERARSCGGAVAAVPVRDTLKRGVGPLVSATVDRRELWMVQTPQAFQRRLLLEAHDRAAETGFPATDDAGLVERAGGLIQLVRGELENIKITEPSDLSYAEQLLSGKSVS